jgi:photosystem II stability/assembly factor-like uncharacterized protein
MQAIASLSLAALIAFAPSHHWVPLRSLSSPIGEIFLFADPERPHVLYGNMGNTTLAISSDAGTTWEAISFAPLLVLNAAISMKPQRTLVALTTTPGGSGPPVFQLHVSEDDGASWSIHDINSPQTGTILGPFAVDQTDANSVYIGLGPCGGACRAGVIRSRDGGRTWSATPLTDVAVEEIESDPSAPGVAYVIAVDKTGEDALYRTVDFGASWTKLQTSLFIRFAIDPSSPSTIYARTSALLRSDDRGDHWSVVLAPFATPTVGDAIAIDPTDRRTIVWTTDFGEGAVLSPDSGVSWFDIGQGLSYRGVQLSDVVFTIDGSLFGRSLDFGIVEWLPVMRRRAVR